MTDGYPMVDPAAIRRAAVAVARPNSVMDGVVHEAG